MTFKKSIPLILSLSLSAFAGDTCVGAFAI